MTLYCLPIIKNRPFEIEKIIETNLKNYQYFEIWIDYINGFDLSFLDELINKYDGRLIVVTRRQSLDPIRLAKNIRLKLISRVCDSNALLDLDITTQKLELEYIKVNHLLPNLITSYHNYQLTPTRLSLNAIVLEMEQYNPAIYKLASHCPDNETALRLLHMLLDMRKNNKKTIIIGMGEHGKITRIYGALWGNEINFAPLSITEASASGQLTRHQYDVLIRELGK